MLKQQYQFLNELKQNFGTLYIFKFKKKIFFSNNYNNKFNNELLGKFLRIFVFKYELNSFYILKNGLEDWLNVLYYSYYFTYYQYKYLFVFFLFCIIMFG